MLTPEQIQMAREKYGIQSAPSPMTTNRVAELDTAWGATPIPIDTRSYGERVTEKVGSDIATRVPKMQEILNRPDTGKVEKGVQAFGQGAGMAAHTLETTLGEVPGVKQIVGAVGAGINWLATSDLSPIKHLGDLIGSSETLQEAVHLYDTDKNFRDTVDGVANIARLGGDVSALVEGGNYVKNVTDKVIANVKARTKTPPPPGPDGGTPPTLTPKTLIKNIKSDILPTTDRIVSHEVTKALDLTQGDVKNISLSTGNDVGEFIARENLIGKNVAETSKNLDAFYKKNYDAVRTEIGNVKTIYEAENVPRYTEALTEIKKQIEDVPGLQEANTEIDALLKKSQVTLNDVQRVKELMDEHFSLYKATGDVKEGIAKSGLTNIRKDLRSFVEDEVKANTSADIRVMNNNVSTARSISDAIETRSTRGLTRSMISTGDIVTYLAGSALTPIGGVLAVIVKKIYQSPSFKLKFVQWLDGLNDAQRAKAVEQLKEGVVPKEIQSLLPESNDLLKVSQESSPVNKSEINSNTDTTKTAIPAKNDLIPNSVRDSASKVKEIPTTEKK